MLYMHAPVTVRPTAIRDLAIDGVVHIPVCRTTEYQATDFVSQLKRRGPAMQIVVKTLLARKLIVDVETEMTIAELKKKMSRIEGWLPGQQRLIYNGK